MALFCAGFLRPWVLRSGVLTSMGSNIQEFLRLFHLTFFSKGSIFHYRPLASGFDEKPETSDFRWPFAVSGPSCSKAD